MRKTILRTVALVMLLGLVLPLLPACGGRLQAFSATYLDETFDTVLTVTVGAGDSTEATRHCRAIKELVNDLHRQFDAYNLYPGMSNIAAVNQAEAGTPVSVSEDVLALLALGREVYATTNGAVHIGMGAVTRLWKTAIAAKTPPDAAAIAKALTLVPDLQAMVLDETHGTVTLTVPCMQLDVGAIAKGYVLDKVRAYAESAGIVSLLCNLGGEILAVGSAPSGDAWEIAIAHPDGGTLETIRVRDAAVAGGGDYERGFVRDGVRYHHIIDPATGSPATVHRAAAVILPLSEVRLADAYCTALMILPGEQGDALPMPPDAATLRVLPNGQIRKSAAWPSERT